MVEGVRVRWNRRPISVLILARVQVWSGRPCATGPLAGSCSRAANRASFSLGRAADPLEFSVYRPPSCQERRQRCTERTLTLSSLATVALSCSAANISAASMRMRSRNARRSAVRPPPCGYLTVPAYRDNRHLSASRHHANKLSSGWATTTGLSIGIDVGGGCHNRPVIENSFNWQHFLRRWQEEWVPDEDDMEDLTEGGMTLADLALAAPPATEAEIAAAEQRLGARLPPSYRQFLGVSNGWRLDKGSIYRLGAAHEIGWFGDPFDMTKIYQEGLTERSTEQEVLLAGMWRRALQLETDSDMSYALLDPGDTDEDGEWALYVYKGWSGELPDRYSSFRSYMQRMYQDFHSDRAHLPGFVNDTTRALDAEVERAREEALSGRWETARQLLTEARRYGRPGAWGMLRQLEVLSHGGGYHGFGELAADPRYTGELVPVMAAGYLRDNRPGAFPGRFVLGAETDDGVTAAADAILAQVRDRTYRYAPGGAFGRAVAEAWESARWGDTDTAWRVIRAALPSWSPPGPDLLAPLGLLGDPVLGPVVTRERGLELLATPRAAGRARCPIRCRTWIRRDCAGWRTLRGGTPLTTPPGAYGWRARSRRPCPAWSGRRGARA